MIKLMKMVDKGEMKAPLIRKIMIKLTEMVDKGEIDDTQKLKIIKDMELDSDEH